MTHRRAHFLAVFALFITLPATRGSAQRLMEHLDRGIVAVRHQDNAAFVSWRLLGTEPQDTAFNLYATTGNADPVKLNDQPLTAGTCFEARGLDFAQTTAFTVWNVDDDGQEGEPSKAFNLPANTPIQPFITVSLDPLPGHYVHMIWVADLNGDGAYDYLVDRLPDAEGTPKLDAYLSDGTFLWRLDTGPNGSQRVTRNDTPSASISGHGNVAGFRDTDNVTAYDFDSNGKAEVAIRTANGVTFGDGTTLEHDNDTDQFISILDGMTGTERARAPFPNDDDEHGPVGGHMGVAYLDGVRPSLVYKSENRRDDVRRGFNLQVNAWDFRDDQLTHRWQWKRGNTPNASNFHQIRIVDVDADGRDEVCDGGYVIDDDGTLLYGLEGVIHGDRFHIGDLDPERPGLEGMGCQQDNDSKLWAYYYDAATGEILRKHHGDEVYDVGRATAADLDPDHPGYEYWFRGGLYNAATGELLSDKQPPANFRIWWDGDALSEVLDKTHVLKWNPQTESAERVLDASTFGAVHSWRNAPPFYGDILGDWREEIIFEHQDRDRLLIFTTTTPTDRRLYTLPHNPMYRLCFTVRGYMQSNMVDFYLGHGMTTPARPRITTDVKPAAGRH